MARHAATLTLLVVAAFLLSACAGGSDEAGSTVACDDAAFRAQDEELYVTQATVANAIGGGGDPATILLDLRRARTALSGYVDAHPPCDEKLVEIAATEGEAIAALDEAIAALETGDDAGEHLARALAAVTAAQRDLGGAP